MKSAGATPVSGGTPRTGGARAARGSTTYAVAAFLQRGIGFVMLPIYVRAMPPAEYGQLAVVLTVAAAIGTLVSFGLETAIFRTWFQLANDRREQQRFVNTVGLFLLVVPISVTGLTVVTVGPLLAQGFSVPADAMALGLLGVAVRTVAFTLPMVLLRAQERLRPYLLVTGISVVADTALMVGFVVVLGAGVNGWLIATLISASVLLVTGLVVDGRRWSTTFEWRHLRFALAFGLPLLPHAFSHWALSLSDRAILGAFAPAADVGVYNLAYQLALPLSVLAVALHQGVMPLYAQASVEEERRHELAAVVTNQSFITLCLGLGAALIGPPFILLAMPETYARATEALPWISLGLTFFGLYLIPMDAISVMAGRTRWVWIATVFAAVANIGLNLWLVPRVGYVAAAVNTAIGYAVLLVAIFVLMLRTTLARIPYEWRRLGLGAFIALGAGALGMIAPPGADPTISLVVRGIILIITMFILWLIATRHRRVSGVVDLPSEET